MPNTTTHSQLFEIFAAAIADAVANRVAEKLATKAAPKAKRLMTVAEAAIYLGKSKQAVYHLVHQDKIPCRRIGAKVYFDTPELDNWINGDQE